MMKARYFTLCGIRVRGQAAGGPETAPLGRHRVRRGYWHPVWMMTARLGSL